MQPKTQYTKNDDASIAYQVIGDSQFDLDLGPGWESHLEYAWEERTIACIYQ